MTKKKLKQLYDKYDVLSEKEWKQFATLLTSKTFHKNSIITNQGQIEKHIYFIVKGLVRLYYLKDGKEHSFAFRFEDSLVSSYTSFLLQKPSKQYIEAIEDTETMAINYSAIQELYESKPVADKFGRLVAENLFIEKELRESSLILDSPDERFLNLLDNNPSWFQRIPQYHLASYLNVSPETLSRIKKRSSL